MHERKATDVAQRHRSMGFPSAASKPRLYRPTIEGLGDMPALIRAALTMTQLSIPLIAGELALGTWQGIYVFEHREMSHRRSVVLHLLGE